MYIISLFVDSNLTVSFSSTQMVLDIIKLRELTTHNAKYGLPALFYGNKTSLSVLNKRLLS